jgi:predicted RNase H-like nuclease (RuvC/YqgF family)
LTSKIKRVSNLQEKRITKSFNAIKIQARKQIASGAKWYAKSDVIAEKFQVEAKTKASPSKSFSIKKEWLDKIADEALQNKRIPVLAINFGEGDDYFVLNSKDFLYLIERLNQLGAEEEW